MLQVTPKLILPANEIELTAMRASGPGGQHVNTADTAIQLRFDIRQSSALPEAVRERLLQRADRRITADGVLVIRCDVHRSRERNRQEALERLAELVRSVLTPPRPRKATRPTRASMERRLQHKRQLGERKSGRRPPPDGG